MLHATMPPIRGLHHVTVVSADPRGTIEFHAGMLGLRLAKRTVNFDDPSMYHLYFGDVEGTPGSLITFFPMPWAARGRQGTGQVATVGFSVLPSAIGFWIERLIRFGVPFTGPATRRLGAGAEKVLSFRDRDGLMLEIVGHARAEARRTWHETPGIDRDHAIRGLHGVTLWMEHTAPTDHVLKNVLGFREASGDETTQRYETGEGGPGTIVDVRNVGGFLKGAEGTGTVHHVAFSVTDDGTQLTLRDVVRQAGLRPTPVLDRKYFRSVYFREPGGVLCEIATVPPGFTVDESPEQLGDHLRLPAQYEPLRPEIEAALPPLEWSAPPSADTSAFGERNDSGDDPQP